MVALRYPVALLLTLVTVAGCGGDDGGPSKSAIAADLRERASGGTVFIDGEERRIDRVEVLDCKRTGDVVEGEDVYNCGVVLDRSPFPELRDLDETFSLCFIETAAGVKAVNGAGCQEQ